MGCIRSKPEPDSPKNMLPISPVMKLDDLTRETARTPKMRASDGKLPAAIASMYQKTGDLGKGVHGKVLMVENRLTKQPYAMKVNEGKDGRQHLETEMSVLRRVRHQHVVQLVQYFEADSRIYLVMELATGGDLFDRVVEKGAFDDKEAARVIRMILDAVQYLHKVGVTHRDLKPDNILYYHPGPDSKVLLTDFKLANVRRSANDVTMNGICGTPEYMAPEVITDIQYTCAVDLWAVGVVTFIVLFGSFPFDDEDKLELFAKIRRVEYTFNGELCDSVSNDAKEFVSKLLVLDPKRRMTAKKALKHRWLKESSRHSSSTLDTSSSGSSERSSSPNSSGSSNDSTRK